MKILIMHSTTKRKIEGAFNICGSKEDLLNVAKQIHDGATNTNFTYGWISIVPEKQEIIPDLEPIPWNS